MSKVLEATCDEGIVKVQGVALPDAKILSEGKGSSTGVVIIDADKQYYIADTTPNLDTTLGKLIDVLGEVKTGLEKAADGIQKVDTAGYFIGSPLTPNVVMAAAPNPGSPIIGIPATPKASSEISAVNDAASAVGDIIGDLEDLKGDLQ